MHQVEKYVKQIVKEIGQPSYMQEFLKQGKDKRAIEDVAKKLKQFSENMSVLQPIAIKGFMVPSGSLMLYHFLAEELDAIEEMLRQEQEGATSESSVCKTKMKERKKAKAVQQAATKAADVLPPEQKEEMQKRVGIVQHRVREMLEDLLPQHIGHDGLDDVLIHRFKDTFKNQVKTIQQQLHCQRVVHDAHGFFIHIKRQITVLLKRFLSRVFIGPLLDLVRNMLWQKAFRHFL